MSSATIAMARARREALKLGPYWSAALYHAVYVPAPGYGTCGISKDSIIVYDPEWVTSVDTDVLAGVLVHEVNHVLRRHHARLQGDGIDPEARHIAIDCEINDDLREQYPAIRGQGAEPETWGMPSGRTAEEYYALLMAGAKDAQKPANKPDRANGWGKDQHGAGAGEPKPGDKEQAAQRAITEAKAQGRTEDEQTATKRAVAEALQSHLTAGKGSAGLRRWVDDVLGPPVVRWQDIIGRALRSGVGEVAGLVDYSYRRPSRRQAVYGTGRNAPILPSMTAPKPRVLAAVDTSGSMRTPEGTACLAEVNGLLRTLRSDILFAAFDDRLHGGVQKVRSLGTAADMMRGGGGTDFRPIFAAADDLPGGRPNVLIVMTDGCGPAPAAAPVGMKVIWVLVGNDARRPAPWGTAVWTAPRYARKNG